MPHAGLLQSNSGEHYVIGNVCACAELHDNVDIIIETEVHLMDQLGIKHKVVGRIFIVQRPLLWRELKVASMLPTLSWCFSSNSFLKTAELL